MVQLTTVLLAKPRTVFRKYLRSGFLDSLRINVQAGSGGNGYPKFGGVGGKGGNVVVVAKENITLSDVFKSNRSKRYAAENGRNSTHNFILGPPGMDTKFNVPVGVSITTELGKHLGELNEEGQELILAKGGPGGHAKNGFLGVKGQTYPVKLGLKLIADIGLVGFPNAGKSTLLKAVSEAKPKIASYPFTTIKPNLGIITYKDLRQISMADLPGLIEGAYANRGMGHTFLKHVERTKLLLLVVDINGFQLSPQYPLRSCFETVLLLNKELELYNEDLVSKPSMILINKMDTDGAQEKYEEIKDHLKNYKEYCVNCPPEMIPKRFLKFADIIPISAKESSSDIENVKHRLRNLLDVVTEMENGENEDNTNLLDDFKNKMIEKGPALV